MTDDRTATGHYRWDDASAAWVAENPNRPADNLVLALLGPDRTGLCAAIDVDVLLERLPPVYHGRIRGNGSAMFSRRHGLGRDFLCEKQYGDHGRLERVRLAGLAASEEDA